jgi:hypothetical protein
VIIEDAQKYMKPIHACNRGCTATGTMETNAVDEDDIHVRLVEDLDLDTNLGSDANALMQPALCWAIYLLILGFPAASHTSANCFGSFPVLQLAFLHPWLAFPHCLALLALLSCTLAMLSHALATFQHLSLIAASAIQEQWLHSTGTSTKHIEPSRVRPTSINASRRCTASLSIGSGLAEARQT